MPVPVVLPQLGENVTEGTVTRWLKKPGDPVRIDEPLLEISTDKVDTEVLSPVGGTLAEVLVAEETTCAIGATLALVHPVREEQADPVAPPAPSAAAAPASAAERSPTPASKNTPVPAASGEIDRTFVTPLVRKLATDHGVGLASVTGTGTGGRIRPADVLAAARGVASAPALAPAALTPAPVSPAPVAPVAVASSEGAAGKAAAAAAGRTEPLSRLRKVIAARMVQSLQVSAQLTSTLEADLSAVVALRARVKEDFAAREGVGLSILPFVAIAAIEALRAHPMVNASVDVEAGTATFHDVINLGIAVDTERGLLAPVVRDAGSLNVVGLAHRIAELAARARSNTLTADELSGGTFTITNTGSRGALFDTPILNQPQVGILGVGATVRRPVVVPAPAGGEAIAIRSMAFLSLTYDHRLVDGADAARYLTTVKQRLEAGQFAADLLSSPSTSPSSIS